MPGNHPRPVNAKWAQMRLSIFLYGVLAMACVLMFRMVQLSLIRGELYSEFSERNYLLTRRFDAPRGTIHDRNGVTLAYNRATFSLSVSPGNLTTPTLYDSLDQLGSLLDDDLTSTYYPEIVRLRPRWKSRLVRRRLTLDEATAVLERRYHLPGVILERRFQRYYPQESSLCHILGYVGKISRARWNREDQLYQRIGYDMDDDIGVMGVEAAFEDVLRGDKGLERIHQSGRGRILRSNQLLAATPGNRIYLTIDLGLQQVAESLLRGRKGVILACNPQNGEMMAWASAPGFNLNSPMSYDDPTSKPQINRAIQEYYQPGSTFKMLTAIAGLESGWSPDRKVFCDRNFYIPNWRRPYTCLGYHGSLDLQHALKHSCNVYFYTMAYDLYTQDQQGYQLVNVAQYFGLAEPTMVGMYEAGEAGRAFGEKAGTLPPPQRFQKERGSVLHLAIGQGPIEVTPLQMLMAYAGLANGRDLLVPLLVREVRAESGMVISAAEPISRRELGLAPEHRAAILAGMQRACYEKGGTAFSAGFDPNWHIAGKTSTAERGADRPADAWFIGIAPVDNPEIVVLVLLEHGGHGGHVAAPLATRMFQYYFDKKASDVTGLASR